MHPTRILQLCTLALAVASTTPLGAQIAPAVVAIAPGDTVTVVHQSMFDRGPASSTPGKRLDVQYTTQIPTSDANGRLAQADRAAAFFGPEAIRIGARMLSIGICDTQACVERRHPPSAWYLYERTRDGWRRKAPDR